MNNPIIEKLRANIQDARTAEYFSEVLSCYYSGNLRSAVVMLYATTICDLIYKLEDLKDLYGDKGAKQILDDFGKQQTDNPKNTDWEKDVPEQCMKANKILSTADYSNFCSLQQLRHLCAHPVLSEKKVLYKPNPDIVLGHIRNMLEGIFVKPAFQTKELFNLFVDDIANVKGILVEHKQFEQYVNSKYFDKFNSQELEYSIFKNLWKLVFALDNDECNENRKINLEALYILLDRHTDFLVAQYEKDKDYYAKKITIENRKLFVPLIKIFNEYPKLFEVLPDDKKIEVKAFIEKDDSWDYLSISFFLQENIPNFVFKVSFRFNDNAIYAESFIRKKFGENLAMDLGIELYGESGSYDTADRRFDIFIKPNLESFSIDQLKKIVEYTNKNSQIFDRWRSKGSNAMIREVLLKKNSDFDFTQYSHFKW